MASRGGKSDAGVIFSFDRAPAKYQKVHDFDNRNGGSPFGSLIQAKDGRLYGITLGGGSYAGGFIFSFHTSAFMYKKLKTIEGENGNYPTGSLIQTNDGKFYGVTNEGGKSDGGVIFSYDAVSGDYVKLEDFGTNKTGNDLYSGLTKAADGKLYGVTLHGGSNGFGVIFSFDPVSSKYRKLKDFDGITGSKPFGSLVQANNGKLYGMTYQGGTGGWWTIYSFEPATSTYAKLYDFDHAYGTLPLGSLVQAKNGKLYGMAPSGGNDNAGVIFSFDPSSLLFKKLWDFDVVNGESPSGGLIEAGNGKLYGVTSAGGSNGEGIIFSFDPSSLSFLKLKEFGAADGARPLASSLMQADNGKLYGTTFDGGTDNAGVIFSFDPASGIYKNLKNFSYNSGGSNPFGTLLQSGDGRLYGVTAYGGSNKLGVVYSYDPAAAVYRELESYDGVNGAYPGNGFAFGEASESPPVVNLLTPGSNATHLAGGNVYLTAAASDADGAISKVEFYKDTTLLNTVTDTPYTFKWQKVNLGNYTLTAKTTNNSGLVTTSKPVHISVVANTPPAVRIIRPANGNTFLNGAIIQLEAAAQDADGRIIKVDFYDGTTLLNPSPERKIPYSFQWQNVPAGVHTITAVAQDNWGAVTASGTVTVGSNTFLGSKPAVAENKRGLYGQMNLKVAPHPARGIITITVTGLKINAQATLAILSSSGVTVKTIKFTGIDQNIPVNVSSLASGEYTRKIKTGNKVVYKKFIML